MHAGAPSTIHRMAWIILFCAGILEVAWAVGLKYTDGFTRLLPTVGTVLAMAGSMALLGLAVRTLPIGTAYAVWTGIGTAGTMVLGIALLGEAASVPRVFFVALIVVGIAGLKLVASK